MLEDNIIWQNSAYYIGIGPLSAQYQQSVVSLFNAFTTNMAPTQPQTGATTANGAGITITGGTGACVAANYWDIGVRGDTGPNNHGSGVTLLPQFTAITDIGDYAGNSNVGTNPNFISQYCDGARTPPEFGASGWAVPAGISDASVPNPIFNLTPVATVDEGNNWINLRWGPLSASNPVTNTILGNYGLATGSPLFETIPVSNGNPYAKTDFFNNPRPALGGNGKFTPGAVEYVNPNAVAVLSVTGGPLTFSGPVGYPTASKTLTLHNTGVATATGITLSFSSTAFSRPAGAAGGTCGTTLAATAPATCTINVVFTPAAIGAASGTLSITANVAVAGSPVGLSGTGVTAIKTATLLPATWTVSHARNCPGTGFLGPILCALDPAQAFTLTNTGNVPLAGIAPALAGSATNVANYTIVNALTTCGAGTTLQPGQSCNIEVQFRPLTAQGTGLKPATITATDAAGTQSSTLNGTASKL